MNHSKHAMAVSETSHGRITRRNLIKGMLGGTACLAISPFAIAQSKIPVKIAWQPGVQLLMFIARQANLFEEQGLDVEYHRFNAGPPMFAALRTASVDVAPMGAPPATIILAQEPKISAFILGSDESHAERLVVQPDSSIESIEDLRGKKIGLWRGTSSDFAVQKALENHGIKQDELEVLDLDVTALVPAFKKKEIDAVWVWDPWAITLEEAGARRLVTDAEVGVRMPDPWLARNEFLETMDGPVKIIAAMDKALDILEGDRDMADKLMAEQLMIEPKMAHEIISNMRFPSPSQQHATDYELSLNAQVIDQGEGLARVLQDMADFLYENDKLSEKPSAMKDKINTAPLQAYIG